MKSLPPGVELYGSQTTRVQRVRLPKGLDQAQIAKTTKTLPQGIELAFCPTGEGGGIDNSCGYGEGGGGISVVKIKELDDVISKAVKLRESAKAKLKEAKASGDKSAIIKWKKARAEANKTIDAAQKEKEALGGGKGTIKTYQKSQIAKLSGAKKIEAIAQNAEAKPTVKGSAAEKVVDERGVVRESCCVDKSVRPTKQHEQVLKEAYKTASYKMTSQEENAVLRYTGTGYKAMNERLRRSEGKETTEYIDLMDSAIDKSPRVPEDVVVTRGCKSQRFAQLATGDEIVDHGYMSTTVNQSTATMFAGPNAFESKEAIFMNIRVPKGSKALYVAGNGLSSQGSNEKELVLPRGSRLRIEGVVTKINKVGIAKNKDRIIRTIQAVLVQDNG